MDANAAARWQDLLDRERIARREANDARDDPHIDTRLRHWWSTVADVLTEYARSIARQQIPEPPPAELASALAGQAGYLASGRVPDTIKRVAGKGRTTPGPTERRDVRMAVAYCLACRPEGLLHNDEVIRIDDPNPVERIHLWFGVAKRTVHDWLKKFEPAFLGVNNIDSEILVNLTVQAAERYRNAGRSTAAIRKRSRKRAARTNS